MTTTLTALHVILSMLMLSLVLSLFCIKMVTSISYTNVSRRAIIKFIMDDARSLGKFVNNVLLSNRVQVCVCVLIIVLVQTKRPLSD